MKTADTKSAVFISAARGPTAFVSDYFFDPLRPDEDPLPGEPEEPELPPPVIGAPPSEPPSG